MDTIASKLADQITALSRTIRRAGLDLPLPPHHLRALRFIEKEPVRPARLAEILHVTPRAITDVIDALSHAGYVSVAADPDDRRAKLVSITPRGLTIREQARKQRHEAAESLFGQLSDDDRRELAHLLSRIDQDSKQK